MSQISPALKKLMFVFLLIVFLSGSSSFAYAQIPEERITPVPTGKFNVPDLKDIQTPRYDHDVRSGQCVENPNGRYRNFWDCMYGRNQIPDVNNPFGECPSWNDFRTVPCIISQEVAFVEEAVFDNVPFNPEEELLFVCYRSNPGKCSLLEARENYENGVEEGVIQITEKEGSLKTIRFQRLCADGKEELKGGSDDCQADGSDYFWPNSIYRISLFKATDESLRQAIREGGVNFGFGLAKPLLTLPGITPLQSGAFYVYHASPEVTVNLKTGGNEVNGMTVNIAGRFYGAGDNNAYYIQLFGPNQTGQESRTEKREDSVIGTRGCLYVPAGSNEATMDIETPPLIPGAYYIKIREGKNLWLKSSELGAPFIRRPDVDNTNHEYGCGPGDFVYYHIPITVAQRDGVLEASVGQPFRDPYGIDDPINLQGVDSKDVCSDADEEEGFCTKVPTGLGTKIDTVPQNFIGSMMGIALSIGGIAATAFFIQAGYTIMTSAGNKEKLQQAREQIIAAIMGLVFIILSIVVLEFIGVNVLRIPGFGN